MKQLNTDTFANALEVISQVMADGAATHGNDEWLRYSAAYHTARAATHLLLLKNDDRTEDHLTHAACRLLMALTQRESQ